MFSQFFVLSLRGDTILHKDCKYLIRLAPPSDTSGKTAKIMATESETIKVCLCKDFSSIKILPIQVIITFLLMRKLYLGKTLPTSMQAFLQTK